MSVRSVHVDVAIFGGGVAGLWLLARLRQLGYQAVLFESQALGAGQTRYSQGIIHGGTKYALTGKLTGSSEAIAGLPTTWRVALNGDGELDLRKVKLLSPNQFMWSTGDLSSNVTGFLASKVMKSRTANVEGDARPEVLRNQHFKGQAYRLDEPVLDMASLIHVLAEPYHNAIFKLPDDAHYRITQRHAEWHVELDDKGEPVVFVAPTVVFTAGSGNASLLRKIGRGQPAMQLRPLQMVMVRGNSEAPLPGALYAHCIGTSASPRVTITTHYDHDGNTVWYIGGQIAEDGVARSPEAQIAAAGHELGELFPWLDLSLAQWGVLPIDRAEVKMSGGRRPDNSYFVNENGVITAWPTKLVLAPRLANLIIESIRAEGAEPRTETTLPRLQHPGYAPLPWQEERWS